MPDQSAITYFYNTFSKLVKLPNISFNEVTQVDTVKSLFMNELLALDTSALRNIQNPSYQRNPDGSTTMAMGSVLLDAPSFYLFAHKTLVSSVFVFAKSLPHAQRRSIPMGGFTQFKVRVGEAPTGPMGTIHRQLGYEVQWLYEKVILKRDKMVQHWQTNAQNKFMTVIYAFDLPVLSYQDPARINGWLEESGLGTLADSLANRYRFNLDTSAPIEHKAAWVEAMHPRFSRQDQDRINAAINPDVFIALPVTEEIVAKIDNFMAKLLEIAIQLNGTSIAID